MESRRTDDISSKSALRLAGSGTDGRLPLGQVLVRSGAITPEQLQAALRQQKEHTKLPLGRLLVKLGHITDDTMRQALSTQLNVPFVDLERMRVDPLLARVINQAYARRHSLLPVSSVGQSLTVCMDDPTDYAAVAELKRTTGYNISIVTASHESIKAAFSRVYSEPLRAVAGDTSTIELEFDEDTDATTAAYGCEFKTADVVVRKLLGAATAQRCSDIHLEMLSNRLGIRFRIDGVLTTPQLGDIQSACDKLARESVSRFKILAKLDIAERRRPQDGSFRIRVNRGDELVTIDLRVSVVPSLYGESVVIRVLDKARLPTSIEGLGLPSRMTQNFGQLLRRSSGILLVTGPTGSGKSTTLYSALKTIYSPQIRVLTAEDPIEYVYEQFSQCEVNEQIGNTFATYLRAFLRHDPEVIMVGEIRDRDTAEMAFRAAQTGHLLLSTLHTTTAVESVTRLRDLGIDPNTIASTLTGVLGQRLVRKVCDGCKATYQPSKHLLDEFSSGGHLADWQFYKGAGCGRCNFTGYNGRVMVAELWVPSQHDLVLMAKDAPMDELVASAARSTFSMAQCAAQLLSEGLTNLEELVRVLPYAAIRQMLSSEAPAAEVA
jgi:type IV pilus assembly protein PilB